MHWADVEAHGLEGATVLHRDREPVRCGPGRWRRRSRGENKDAYDLYYVVRNFRGGPADVAVKLRPLVDEPEAQRALAVLRRDFAELDAVGPTRVAAFVTGGRDDDLQADVVAFIAQLLAQVET